MSRTRLPTAITGVSIALLLAGCGIYDKYGYGKIAGSRIDRQFVTPVAMPANAPSISQRFRPAELTIDSEHKGFDVLVPHRTPVIAAGDGTVRRVRLSFLYGKQIMVDHGRTESGYRIQTRYYHLTEQLVEEGDVVRRGQLLAYSGATGLAAGGFPHLHFEVHRLNEAQPPSTVKYLDPQLFWVDGAGRITCYSREREYPAAPIRLTYPVPCRDLSWQ